MNQSVVVKSNAPLPVVETSPFDQFLTGQLTERTRRAYYNDLCQFFGSADISLEQIRSVTFHSIIAYRNALAEKAYKRSTINRKLASIKAFFRMLTASGYIESNPADSTLVRGYKQEDNPGKKAIAQKELNQILNVISQVEDSLFRARDTALFYLLTYGGLRRSEAANMSWDDLSQDGAFYLLNLPETKAGVAQDIKVQPTVVHYLEEYRKVLKSSGLAGEGKVFISLSRNGSAGRPLSDHSINQLMKKYALKAGVSTNITAHMFRHTCCTLAIEGGAKPQQVQAHLRHKDLKTTMRYYENRERLVDNASDYINL